eukprot:GHVT01033588.1.p1 GENE.GHVT01033588.1~~GHVT01033588.1.p1  ORF type:complete len:807 (+),score=221.16 GHVT01033588.1:222-2642(+)
MSGGGVASACVSPDRKTRRVPESSGGGWLTRLLTPFSPADCSSSSSSGSANSVEGSASRLSRHLLRRVSSRPASPASNGERLLTAESCRLSTASCNPPADASLARVSPADRRSSGYSGSESDPDDSADEAEDRRISGARWYSRSPSLASSGAFTRLVSFSKRLLGKQAESPNLQQQQQKENEEEEKNEEEEGQAACVDGLSQRSAASAEASVQFDAPVDGAARDVHSPTSRRLTRPRGSSAPEGEGAGASRQRPQQQQPLGAHDGLAVAKNPRCSTYFSPPESPRGAAWSAWGPCVVGATGQDPRASNFQVGAASPGRWGSACADDEPRGRCAEMATAIASGSAAGLGMPRRRRSDGDSAPPRIAQEGPAYIFPAPPVFRGPAMLHTTGGSPPAQGVESRAQSRLLRPSATRPGECSAARRKGASPGEPCRTNARCGHGFFDEGGPSGSQLGQTRTFEGQARRVPSVKGPSGSIAFSSTPLRRPAAEAPLASPARRRPPPPSARHRAPWNGSLSFAATPSRTYRPENDRARGNGQPRLRSVPSSPSATNSIASSAASEARRRKFGMKAIVRCLRTLRRVGGAQLDYKWHAGRVLTAVDEAVLLPYRLIFERPDSLEEDDDEEDQGRLLFDDEIAMQMPELLADLDALKEPLANPPTSEDRADSGLQGSASRPPEQDGATDRCAAGRHYRDEEAYVYPFEAEAAHDAGRPLAQEEHHQGQIPNPSEPWQTEQTEPCETLKEYSSAMGTGNAGTASGQAAQGFVPTSLDSPARLRPGLGGSCSALTQPAQSPRAYRRRPSDSAIPYAW